MFLKRIEMQGFKSFVDKISLDFAFNLSSSFCNTSNFGKTIVKIVFEKFFTIISPLIILSLSNSIET